MSVSTGIAKSGILLLAIMGATASARPVQGATQIELTLTPNPPAPGETTLNIKLTDESGKVVEGAQVTMLVSMPAMGTMPYMEEKAEVSSGEAGFYDAKFDLAMGGTWDLALTVRGAGREEVFYYSITTGIPGVSSKGSGKTSTLDGLAEATNLLDLGPERLQKIAVRFAEAKLVPMRRVIEAVGIVEQDQTHREEVTLRYSGYVVKQFRGRVGDYLKAGEPLFSVYSPDLVTAQSEMLLAHKMASDGGPLRQAALDRLRNLGLSDIEIAEIRRARKPKRDVVIRATVGGTILDIRAREGAAVHSGQVIYVIGDLSKTYLVARVFQQDIGDLNVGQPAEVKIPGAGGKALAGVIDLIYPQLEQGAGTANVRVEVKEATPSLRPGVYADLYFPVELGSLLAIPSEAVLYSGRHRYVFVDRGQGVLEPREVEVGRTADGLVEVQTGLKRGERVVASGTFLLGSEAQLRSALPKWRGGGPRAEAPHTEGMP